MADVALWESMSKAAHKEGLREATDQLVHGTSDHMLGHDDRTGDGEDGAILVFT